jgi:Tfp pilus assembly protein PilF
MLGVADAAVGQNAEAEQLLRRALAIDSMYAPARQALAKLRR